MKNIKDFIYAIMFALLATFGLAAFLVYQFGWVIVIIVMWFFTAGCAIGFFTGRHYTFRDMQNGAKLAVASQESVERKERATMTAFGQFIKGSNQAQQPALPEPNDIADNELIFDDGDFVFADAGEGE